MKKRILSIILTIFIILSIMQVGLVSVSASGGIVNFGGHNVNLDYGPGDYFTDDYQPCKVHYSNVKCKSYYNGIYLGACQCFGYARYVQQKIFAKNSYTNSSSFYKVSGASVSAGTLTADKLKDIMLSSSVKPGAHLRTLGSTQHSMIITNIFSTGFSIIQCNGSNNNEYSSWTPCRIGTYTYTWSSYVSSTYGKRGIDYIEMPKEYNWDDIIITNHNVDNNYPTPIIAVPKITSGSINVYDIYGNEESGRRIDANDNCTIEEVYTDGWCLVSYPSGSTTRSAYVKKTEFFENGDIVKNNWSPSTKTNAYKYSNLSGVFGSVFTTDKCVVVGQYNNTYQVIYPITSGFKLGWIDSNYHEIVPEPLREEEKFIGPVANGAFNEKTLIAMSLDEVDMGWEGSIHRRIYQGDICIISNVDPNTALCTVEYPTGGACDATAEGVSTRTVSGISINHFINYNGSAQAQTTKIPQWTYAFPTSDMTDTVGSNKTNWWLDEGDTYTTINNINGATEVLYYCSQGRHEGKWKLGWIWLDYYYLDLNGYIDNADCGGLNDYGTADIYINGNILGNDVKDFYRSFPAGSTYEIKDIRAYMGYTYNGVQSGNLSGTLTDNAEVKLNFTKDPVTCAEIVVTKNPTKFDYLEGDELDTSGLVVNANYSDGSSKDVTSQCTFSGYESTPGVKTVTASYNGKKTAFSVNVNKKKLKNISIVSTPSKKEYYVGENIDLTGLKVKAIYNNNTDEIVDNYDIFDVESITESVGTKTINILYYYDDVDSSASFDINVSESEESAPKIIVSCVSANAGDTVDVKISLQNNPGLASMKLKASYDSSLLTLTNVTYNSQMGGSSQAPQTLASPVTLNWYNGAADCTGDCVYATLTFKISDNVTTNKTTSIDITYNKDDVYNIAENNINFAVDNGTVSISPNTENAPKISITGAKVTPGKTVDVNVELANNTGFASMGIEIGYNSDVMTLTNAVNNTNVGGTYTPAQYLTKNPYNMGWSNTNNILYNGNIATLTFEIKEDAPDGIYPITIDYYKGVRGDYTDGDDVNYDEEWKSVGFVYVSNSIVVASYTPGDINGDSRVNDRDATYLLRYLAGWNLSDIVTEALDVNGSNSVNDKDATILLRYLAGWQVELK